MTSIPNISTFETKYQFFAWWDAQDHTKHSSQDFLFFHLVHAHFHGLTYRQTLAKLKKAFPPTTSRLGRKPFETLRNKLNYFGGWCSRYGFQNGLIPAQTFARKDFPVQTDGYCLTHVGNDTWAIFKECIDVTQALVQALDDDQEKARQNVAA